MSLLFNMLSRFVIAFLPRSKCLWISWLQSPSAVILEPPKIIESVTTSTVSLSICHEVMGPDAIILVFWMLSFKPAFSLSYFTFIKRLLMRVKDSDKLNIQKTKIMASGVPTLNANRWGKSGSSDRFIFFGSQITAEDVCNNDIKRHLLLGRKAMTNLDSILKSRDITLPTKFHRVDAMVFQ